MNLWLVRAGRDGEYEDASFERGTATLDYPDVPDLRDYPSPGDLEQALSGIYPEPKARAVHLRQLWALYREVRVGDAIVTPLRDRQSIRLGLVEGPYAYHSGAVGMSHAVQVRWLRRIAKSELDPDIRTSMNYSGTLIEIKLDDGQRRAAADQLLRPDAQRGGREAPRRLPIPTSPPGMFANSEALADPEVRRQAMERRNTAHFALVAALDRQATLCKIPCDCTQYADAMADGCIFEMKSLEYDEVSQVRAAVGQLYHYLFLHRNEPGYANATLCAVFDKPIDPELCTFLSDRANIGVVWLDDARFEGTEMMRQRHPWIFTDYLDGAEVPQSRRIPV